MRAVCAAASYPWLMQPSVQVPAEAVAQLSQVGVLRGSAWILRDISLTIEPGQRWAVIGPNGAGKSTLLHLLAAMAAPATGTADVLGERLGRTDVQTLRTRIGFAGVSLTDRIPGSESVADAVLTGAWAVYSRRRENYDIADEVRRDYLLNVFGLSALSHRSFGTLSEGERKRVMIARALMPDPELLVLDEPAAGLDLAAREDLIRRLQWFADDPSAPALVLATHHLEEIPPATSHVAALRGGNIVQAGFTDDVLTNEVLTQVFGLPVAVETTAISGRRRWFARAAL